MKKNYLFLGFTIPDIVMNQIFKEDRFPGVQTHKFNWNLVKGLEKNNEFDFTYISTKPISDYPYNNLKFIKKATHKLIIENNIIEITEIPFINQSILKLITRFLSGFYYSIKKYTTKKNKAGVIVYSVHVPYLLIGYFISRLFRIELIGIWTDPPSVVSDRESSIKSKLRKYELIISKKLMNKVSKVIVLSKYLAEDFAPKKPYLVIEGIIDTKEANNIDIPSKTRKQETTFVYTGSLEKRYGIENIVEGFKLLDNENIVLDIYGRGDYERELTKISQINKNINYNGFISNNNILDVQRNADFLLNARSPQEDFVKYSFPSKTLEYMLSGTPLISTMLPGIPNEYSKYIFKLDDNNPNTIARSVYECSLISQEARKKMGQKALAFAKTKDYITQGNKIVEFLKNNC